MLLDLCCQVARTQRLDYFETTGRTGYRYAQGCNRKKQSWGNLTPESAQSIILSSVHLYRIALALTKCSEASKLIVNLAYISVMFPTWRQKIMERSFRGSVGSNDIFIGFKRSIIFRALPRRGRQETGDRRSSWTVMTTGS